MSLRTDRHALRRVTVRIDMVNSTVYIRVIPPTTRAMKKHFSALLLFLRNNYLLIAILLIALIARTYRFGDVPPGLNQDEAATGYDAFAVLTRGVDRMGTYLPLMYISWGTGMYALPGYLMSPFIWLFGLSVSSIRLLNLVCGFASLIVFYDLVRRTFDRKLALIAVFSLAICPWHMMVSRWALDSNLLPFLMLFGVYCVVRSKEQPGFLYGAAAFFSLCFYAYGTSYAFIPVFFVGLCAYLYSQKNFSWGSVTGPFALFVLLSLPAGLYLLVNQLRLPSIETPLFTIPLLPAPPRYQTDSTFFQGDFLRHTWENLQGFWQLMLSQNDGQIWNSVPGFGTIYLFSLPLVFVGLFVWLQQKKNAPKGLSPTFLMGWWLVACVALASLLQPVNINRVNVIFIPLIFFIAVAINAIGKSRFALGTIVAVYLIAFASFSHAYFTSYERDSAGPFFDSLEEAVDYASENVDGDICVTGNVNQPYIFVLFFRSFDPVEFQRTVDFDNEGTVNMSVRSFGRYMFGLDACGDRRYDAYVIDPSERGRIPEGYDFVSFERFDVAIRR